MSRLCGVSRKRSSRKAYCEKFATANITKNPARKRERGRREDARLMAFALSASWNAFRHTDGNQLLFEIKQAGFREIELSFNLTVSMVQQIQKTAGREGLDIISLHNYCPIPDEVPREEALPDCYSISSCDEVERNFALKYAKRSIETAAELGAKAVVLHCGRVEVADNTRPLVDLVNRGLKGSKEFKSMFDRAVQERKSVAQKFLAQALRSLDELNAWARERNVLLGVETRFYYREIPSFEEIGIILDKFKGSNISYWHDTGHAQIMEMVGFSRHAEFLKHYGSRMVGIHLHDVLNGQDHLAPSQGTVDFNQLTPYLSKDTLKVIEAHHPATVDQLKKSEEYLRRVFDGRI